jgi:hypothetical protein
MLEQSPGEAACSNVEIFDNSLARQGILHARVGGGCIVILREEEVKATYFLGSKTASDVELGTLLFFQLVTKLARRLLWTPYQKGYSLSSLLVQPWSCPLTQGDV